MATFWQQKNQQAIIDDVIEVKNRRVFACNLNKYS